MADGAQHDLGPLDALEAEALGLPGQRRFRLLVRSESRSASIWMEKQQLDAIGRLFDVMSKAMQRSPATVIDLDSE